MSRKIVLMAAVVAILTAWTGTASATPFILNQSGCCGSGPFGTVNVTQFGPVADHIVDVLVTLNSGVDFVVTGNGTNHPGFAFNLSGAPSLTGAWTLVQTGNLQGGGLATWAFSDFHSSPATMSDSYGTYEYAFNCSNCGSGASNPALGPLEFRINLAGITPASFVANAAGTYFAADIINGYPTGATGLVRTTSPTTPPPPAVPEPASMILLGTGLVGLATRIRRKK